MNMRTELGFFHTALFCNVRHMKAVFARLSENLYRVRGFEQSYTRG